MHVHQRLVSLDAFRGFIMLMMVSSGFGLVQMAKGYPESAGWQAVAFQLSHVEWAGCALWDLIQPAFMFMVGMAVLLSMMRRKQEGQGFAKRGFHALLRAVALVLLGVLLATRAGDGQTNWIFTNVLAQIGLGYVFLFVLASLGWEYCAAAVVVILVGDWYWFFQHPVTVTEEALAAAGANAGEVLPGRFIHWSKHVNVAAEFDRWLLNLLPRGEPFVTNAGGYTTMNFVPALATMLLGAVTGERLMRSGRTHGQRAAGLLIAGVVCLLVGTVMGFVAVPVVKRIWTPSWVMFSGGWVLMMLAAFYWLVEVAGWRRLVFPLVVVGMNSLFIYVMHSLAAGWILTTLKTHAGAELFGGSWGPVWERCSVLAVLWLLCFWLYRQRAFLRL
ncbi:heparan-alpha-glucosaminide N-acetyltransferase domain-containing protein [Prosthecobacter sp. SYSU 5D2]|uniref:acyltransferase family protein n=1 Tax=Prosthecobacter sp. SYSU 5D2 TaxID=3134134 RepID=UPI0031FE6CCE